MILVPLLLLVMEAGETVAREEVAGRTGVISTAAAREVPFEPGTKQPDMMILRPVMALAPTTPSPPPMPPALILLLLCGAQQGSTGR